MRTSLVLIWSIACLSAACGSEDRGDGATLTVRAPAGPTDVGRFDIILANAADNGVLEVQHQRANPADLSEQDVRYYRQRATAGSIEEVDRVDGFVLRIQANPDANPDAQFIPFLVAWDTGGGIDRLLGVGAVLDANGDPTEIVIQEGRSDAYFVDLIALDNVEQGEVITRGASLVVECAMTGEPFRSGIAWHPGNGPQLRLLLGDPALDRDDASDRALDLDCDSHEAIGDDCDDVRATFHPGQAELCDGADTNCDGRQLELMECGLAPGTCGPAASTGVQVCIDRNGGSTPEQCEGTPACQCAVGNVGTCRKCILDFKATTSSGEQQPCAPALGLLDLGCTSDEPCRVDVMDREDPFVTFIALAADGGLGKSLTDVRGPIAVEVKLRSGPTVVAAPQSSIGATYLAVTTAAGTTYVGVDLQIGSLAVDDCTEVTPGVNKMVCSEQ